MPKTAACTDLDIPRVLDIFRFVVLDEDAIGYKKVYYGKDNDATWGQAILTLLLPAGTLLHLSKDYEKKCRASQAIVIAASVNAVEFMSSYKSDFKYYMNGLVLPHYFDPEFKECAGGIHFFKTKKLAKDYEI